MSNRSRMAETRLETGSTFTMPTTTIDTQRCLFDGIQPRRRSLRRRQPTGPHKRLSWAVGSGNVQLTNEDEANRPLLFRSAIPSPIANARVANAQGDYFFFDESFPPGEQLPRIFCIEFKETQKDDRPAVALFQGSKQIGDVLTDNASVDDGYRYHDVFHFAHAAVLGWSPMSRTLFACKRRSIREIDEVEDGGRAKILEEAICAIVFAYARERDFLTGATTVDDVLLDTIKRLTETREARHRSARDWQDAILQGFSVWRQMRANRGGVLHADLNERRISYSNA